ncbi:MAG: hypothetical protein ACFFC7_25605, partial [Candidatus Hermodarchaeota archaeon]
MESWSQIRKVSTVLIVIMCILVSFSFLVNDFPRFKSFQDDLIVESPLTQSNPSPLQEWFAPIALKSPKDSPTPSSTINVTHSEHKIQTASLNQTINFGSAQEACNSS